MSNCFTLVATQVPLGISKKVLSHALVGITVNSEDFRKLCCDPEKSQPGLIIIPSVSRVRQIQLIESTLEFIGRVAPPAYTGRLDCQSALVEVTSGGVTYADQPQIRKLLFTQGLEKIGSTITILDAGGMNMNHE